MERKNMLDILRDIKAFLEAECFDKDELIDAVTRIDADANGKITYKELVVELGKEVRSEDRSRKWATKLLALVGSILVGVTWYLTR